MAIGIFLFIVFVLLSSAAAWIVKLVNSVPAMQDMMPSLLPGEQFFIVFARRPTDKKETK